MLNKELYMVILPGVSWVLFALGGTQISDTVPGWKGWRRYILPLVYFLICMTAVLWWQALLVALLAVLVYSMGYGKLNTWQRWLLGIGYGLICVPIGLSAWCIVTAVMFGLLFWLSNTKATQNMFTWKICEGFFGLFVGIEIAYLLMGLGLLWIHL